MEWVQLFLTPIFIPTEWLFGFFVEQFASAGIAIIVLALTFSVLLHPLQKWGKKIEMRITIKEQQVRTDMSKISSTLRGEERFHAIEAIYQQHSFHPIHNVLSGMSFIIQLPFLIVVLLLLLDNSLLNSQSFLFIQDLSQSDNLGGYLMGDKQYPINLLPLVLFIIGVIDAIVYYKQHPASRNKFIFISFVIGILIYPLPAAIVLYWILLNLFSSFLGLLFKWKQ